MSSNHLSQELPESLLKILGDHPVSRSIARQHIKNQIISAEGVRQLLPPPVADTHEHGLEVVRSFFNLLDKAGKGLLMLMSSSYTPGISARLLQGVLGTSPAPLCAPLIRRGFIQELPESDLTYYEIPPLVQEFARRELNARENSGAARQRMDEAIAAFLESCSENPADEAYLRLEMQNVLAAALDALNKNDTRLINRFQDALARKITLIEELGFQEQWKKINEPQADTIAANRVASQKTQLSTDTALIIGNDLYSEFQEATVRHDRSEMARLAMALGSEHAELNQADAAMKYYRQGITLYQELGDLWRLITALEIAAGYAVRSGNAEEAQKYAIQGINIAQQLGDETARGRIMIVLGDTRAGLGDYNGAMDSHKRAIKILRSVDDSFNTGIALGKLSALYLDHGGYREAVAALTKAAAIFEDLQRRDLLGRTLGNLGTALGNLGHWQKAGERHAAAMQIARELGDLDEERFQLRNLAHVAERDGYFNWAVKYNRQALHLALLERDQDAVADITFDIGRLLLDDPASLAQVAFLLEYSNRLKTRPQAARLLDEVLDRIEESMEIERPIAPAETDLEAYAAAAYPEPNR